MLIFVDWLKDYSQRSSSSQKLKVTLVYICLWICLVKFIINIWFDDELCRDA